MAKEYRICWNASSNAFFRGATDWDEWDDPDDVIEEVLSAVPGDMVVIPEALNTALDASGFNWWVETRDA